MVGRLSASARGGEVLAGLQAPAMAAMASLDSPGDADALALTFAQAVAPV